jgi:hypothetical protein
MQVEGALMSTILPHEKQVASCEAGFDAGCKLHEPDGVRGAKSGWMFEEPGERPHGTAVANRIEQPNVNVN